MTPWLSEAPQIKWTVSRINVCDQFHFELLPFLTVGGSSERPPSGGESLIKPPLEGSCERLFWWVQ